jgi:biotin carboxylase
MISPDGTKAEMSAIAVLLLVPATSYRALAFVSAAARMGLPLEIGTDSPAALAHFGLPIHAVDFNDLAVTLAALGAARFAGVVATDEKSAWLAAELAQAGITAGRYHRPSGVEAARDKRLMRAVLSRAGVLVPGHVVLSADGEPGALAPRFPCVVKPPMLSGSQGVIRADDRPELERAVARTRAILQRHPSELRELAGFFDILVEDYIAGDEVAVEAIVRDGELTLLALFDKPEPLVGPFFEETIYVAPSSKPDELQRRIVSVAHQAALALGLRDGPIHAELRLDGDRPVVIEIAARSIGGLCSRALVLRCGSLEERLLALAAGYPDPPLSPQAPAIGVMMIPVPRSGVLRGAFGIDRARAVAGIDGVELTVLPEQAVRALPEGNSYLGFIFAHGASSGEVVASLKAAHAELRFDLKPLLPVVGSPTAS